MIKPNEADLKKIKYRCPKCTRVFLLYSSASRHIQERHCVNSDGEEVSPDSPDLIKPIRLEMPVECSKETPAQNTTCSTEEVDDEFYSKTVYICEGCYLTYANIRMFDLHAPNLHSADIESMFFSTLNEFNNWKQQLEMQTKAEYVISSSKPKQIYRCAFESTNEKTSIVHLCPSRIVVQGFSKGLQVHYYKQHYGHACNKYELSKKFKQFTITNFLNDPKSQKDIAEAKMLADLYLQFKTLMSGIVLDAAKIKIPKLKILHEKALEMVSILKSCDDSGNQLDMCVGGDSTSGFTDKSKMTDGLITIKVEGTSSPIHVKREVNATLVPENANLMITGGIPIEQIKCEIDTENLLKIYDEETENILGEGDLKYEIKIEDANHSLHLPDPELNTGPIVKVASEFAGSDGRFFNTIDVDTSHKITMNKTGSPLQRTRKKKIIKKKSARKGNLKTKVGTNHSHRKAIVCSCVSKNNIEDDSNAIPDTNSFNSETLDIKAEPDVEMSTYNISTPTEVSSSSRKLRSKKYVSIEQENDHI